MTRLSELDIPKPIDLVLDMGCYHTLSAQQKPRYVEELAAILEPGTPMMMWQGIRIRPGEIAEVFSPHFAVERTEPMDFVVRRKLLRHNITAQWYWLRRRSG